MNGSRLLIVVLLLVLAIPLMANSALVNPVSGFSAISIINSKEEVVRPDLYTTVTYEMLAIKPDEIVLNLPDNTVEITYKGQTLKAMNFSMTFNTNNTGGVHRIKSGRH